MPNPESVNILLAKIEAIEADYETQLLRVEDLQAKILFSLVQVQNQSFGPKQNAKFTLNHHQHPPPIPKLFTGF